MYSGYPSDTVAGINKNVKYDAVSQYSEYEIPKFFNINISAIPDVKSGGIFPITGSFFAFSKILYETIVETSPNGLIIFPPDFRSPEKFYSVLGKKPRHDYRYGCRYKNDEAYCKSVFQKYRFI